MRNQILSLCAVATLTTGATASAALIADYRMNGGPHDDIPGNTEIQDSQGPLFSNSTNRVNFPRWVHDMPDGLPAVPNNPGLGAPADGVALRFGQSHGYQFDQGAEGELADALQQGSFTVFARVLKTNWDSMHIFRQDGAMDFRFAFGAGNQLILRAQITQAEGTTTVETTVTDKVNQWMDVAMVFDQGEALRLYVDGAMINSATVPDQTAVATTNQAEIRQLSNSYAYMESLRVYDHALSNAEVAALSIPEPASLSVLGIGAAGLLARRRRGAAG